MTEVEKLKAEMDRCWKAVEKVRDDAVEEQNKKNELHRLEQEAVQQQHARENWDMQQRHSVEMRAMLRRQSEETKGFIGSTHDVEKYEAWKKAKTDYLLARTEELGVAARNNDGTLVKNAWEYLHQLRQHLPPALDDDPVILATYLQGMLDAPERAGKLLVEAYQIREAG